MDRRKKIALAVLVIAVGTAVAFQFRKEISQRIAQVRKTEGSVEAANSPTGTAEAPQKWAEPQPPTKSQDSAASRGISAESPQSLSQLIDPVSTAPRPRLSDLIEVNRAPGMIDLRAPEQSHTIADGDTLPKLATRYLGSADYAWALFDHNRDVLRNPDELPIGAVLRIPSPVTLPANPEKIAPTQPAADPPLVPATPSQPVKLNKLINADAAKAAPQRRTYTVQPGDSLVDIARKFYGDGRRYETLFEANRQVITNPTQLKPGTILLVP